MALLPVLLALLQLIDVHARVPAHPSNRSALAQGTEQATLGLQWYSNGSDSVYVARQPVGSSPLSDPVQGVLLHFSENSAGNGHTATPWIAFITCDGNAANSSSETDVLTLARDHGAKSAILYSLYSQTCVTDPGYQDSVLDVFSTQSLNASRHIEYEFGQFGPSSEAYFNATMLNNAAEMINKTYASDYPAGFSGFLFATLLAYNASAPGTPGGGLQNDADGTQSSSSPSSQNTGVAMIILYTITGCVSALFCAVIVSGAIRAVRYPERYGPRTGDPTLGGGQSRARGLGRAILDTFPIVKFRSGSDGDSDLTRHKDVEAAPVGNSSSASMPLRDSVRPPYLSPTAEQQHDLPEGTAVPPTDRGTGEIDPAPEGAGLPSRTNIAERGQSSSGIDARMPDRIGRETCPICIVDFEEGDDLRVLPCEGKHRFHQSCVDPWLLELSGSCPICRQDFHALETLISGDPGDEGNRDGEANSPSRQNRFSRYLRTARRRREQQEPLPPSES